MSVLRKIKCTLKHMAPAALTVIASAPVFWFMMYLSSSKPSVLPDLMQTYTGPSDLDLTIIYVVGALLLAFILFYQDCGEKK